VPKGILVVQSRPSDPSREGEFNEWYADTHIPEVCAIPGIVSARRYKVHDAGFVLATWPSTRSTRTISPTRSRSSSPGPATVGSR
jgi:hypothetical protein